MKLLSALCALPLALLTAAAPLEKRAITDADILQFALTLEHLENVFYKEALASIPESSFLAAGYSSQFYTQLQYIAHDEETHVVALETALKAAGVTPVAACTYSFPFTDAFSFATLSAILEGVGTSAYLGAAPYISDPAYLVVAGSILSVEALHTSQQRAYIGLTPFADPFYPPIIANGAYTLAAAFIKSCPSSNPPLPFTAFPTLTATSAVPTYPSGYVTFLADGTLPSTYFVTYVYGITVTSVPATGAEGSYVTSQVPSDAQGQTYVFLTDSKVTAITDSAILFGPAIIQVTPPAPTYDPSIL